MGGAVGGAVWVGGAVGEWAGVVAFKALALPLLWGAALGVVLKGAGGCCQRVAGWVCHASGCIAHAAPATERPTAPARAQATSC